MYLSSDYYNSKDLHIGVTNSHGYVVEFSEEGICGVDTASTKWGTREPSADWDQCLLLEQFDELWNEIWDSVLMKVRPTTKLTTLICNLDGFCLISSNMLVVAMSFSEFYVCDLNRLLLH